MKNNAWMAFLFVLFLNCNALDFNHLVLTWVEEDTSRHMAVNFGTGTADEFGTIHFDSQSREGKWEDYAYQQRSQYMELDKTFTRFHQAVLRNLSPATDYYFVIRTESGNVSEEYRFRTLPDDDRPLRYISGGDLGVSTVTRKMNQLAASMNPDFIVLGGDLAYENGNLWKQYNWRWLVKTWKNDLRSPEGRLIPLIVAIGNHETNKEIDPLKPLERAPFFYRILQQDAQHLSYFKRNVGSLMTFIVLDTEHIYQMTGPQRDWLEMALEQEQHRPYKYAVYHVPLYASHRDENLETSLIGRDHWVPIFDQFNLTVAWENHDHAHKRTYPLRGNQIVSDGSGGTLYLGDGCWGKTEREVYPERWYLEKATSKVHFWRVDVNSSQSRYQAIDLKGRVFDEVVQSAPLLELQRAEVR